MNSELKYLYRPKWTAMVLALLFFGLCAAVLFYIAKTNDRGLIINGIIELEVFGATVFYWVLGALSSLFVLAGAFGLYAGLTGDGYLTLSRNELVIPPVGFSRKGYSVPLNKPFALDETNVSGQVLLKISGEGKPRTITKSFFESEAKYEEIKTVLRAIREKSGE